MRRLTGIGLSAAGLMAMAIVPLAAPHSDRAANLQNPRNDHMLISLKGRFSNSFYDGPGGLNS